jgi:8-oxo-dGTP pyrophosphatase MutT (NUDIX family)
VVFVRQYRHGVQQILLELPAGNFDATQENSLEAARRELQEETGYVAKNMIKLCELYGDPVKETNTLHVFLGENVEKTAEIALDITENIEVVLISLDQVKEKICNNEIMVCGSISAIFFALNYLGL